MCAQADGTSTGSHVKDSSSSKFPIFLSEGGRALTLIRSALFTLHIQVSFGSCRDFYRSS